MGVDVLLGLQWGDEGKGKIVDVLTPQYDIIARFQGGPNAGHTLEFEGIKHVLHTIPSGIFRNDVMNIIGNGVVIDPVILQKEIKQLEKLNVDVQSKLLISKKAHLILPTHKLLDQASEIAKGKQKIGSTLKGIGPTYMDKTGRNGLRIGDISSVDFNKKYQKLKEKHFKILKDSTLLKNLDSTESEFLKSIEYIKKFKHIDSEHYLNNASKNGKKILAEGAQGTLLDIDFGTYPYVTSSNTITAGTCTGLGIAPNKIKKIVGIFKAYCTRVGSGPFPSELKDEIGEKIRQVGHEFGATTGRERRCGWIDLPALKYAIMINGVTELSMMKADVLDSFEDIYVCTHYIQNEEKINFFPFDLSDDTKPVFKKVKGWNQAKDSFKTPNLYYISAQEKDIIKRLKANKVEMKMISKDTSMLLGVYRVVEFSPSKKPYEGHFKLNNIKVQRDKELVQLKKGDYVLNSNQDAALFIHSVLQPELEDAYLTWNFFDSYLQQKEYFSSYIFIDKIEEILNNDIELKRQYELKKKEDKAFASSEWDQLYFIYKRSKYFEKSYNRLPVYYFDSLK